MNDTPTIEKTVYGTTALYTLTWSHLRKADRYEIRFSVPSRSGLYELYYMDDVKRLVLADLAVAWYGGIRNTLRALTDPEIEQDPSRKAFIEQHEYYYRYSLSDSFADLNDVLHFLSARYFPAYEPAPHSNRFESISVNQLSPDKVTDIFIPGT
jgi:hypothetical protein